MGKPFFKKSHACWYVHHQGRIVRLSADKTEAFQRYHELLAGSAPTASTETVASLLNTYLAWCEKNRSPDTYTWYRHFLSSFARSVGQRLQIANLKPFHVTNWLDNPLWNQTTRGDAVRGVKRVFNWAVKQGYLSHSPLQNVERPAAKAIPGLAIPSFAGCGGFVSNWKRKATKSPDCVPPLSGMDLRLRP